MMHGQTKIKFTWFYL